MSETVYEDIILIIGTVLSIICSFCVLTTWCILPQWRTLQIYISLNQIIIGTLHLCGITIITIDPINEAYIDYYKMTIFTGYLFLATISWTLCSSLLAYLRLVFLYTGEISHCKVKATIFSYGIVAVVVIVTDGFLSCLSIDSHEYSFFFLPLYILVSINFVLFIRIILSVMSCCGTRMSNRNMGHVLSLVGVGILCDSVLVTQLVIIITVQDRNWLYCISMFFFTHRLVFQSIVVLLKKSSIKHWKTYIRKRRHREFHLSI